MPQYSTAAHKNTILASMACRLIGSNTTMAEKIAARARRFLVTIPSGKRWLNTHHAHSAKTIRPIKLMALPLDLLAARFELLEPSAAR